MSAESPRHARSGGPLTVPSQPPSDRSIIDAVSGFINDVTLSSSSAVDPKDVIQWARFETADINEPAPEGDSDSDISPLLLILGYGAGVQVWLIPPSGEAQEVLSWRQGTVRVLRILPTPQHGDSFASKRPLIALCDSSSPGPTFCSLSFISIRGGEQVKSIKFKNPILDVLANKRSVVVSFSERFAVFDAGTLEDRMAVTTCYPCPCPLGSSSTVNPLALGDRWLAYADKKLNQSKRSSGGCDGEGVTSYTATVLHAAKSLSKGLRGLGETVAHSLAGGRSTSQSPSPPNTDVQQPGVVTILDIENNEEEDGQDSEELYDPIVAHFIAHSEAIIALKFDASGMLLVTADRRGHDFHVFRVNPHPCGSSLASVHHLYTLHRGDTTAKVQDISISADSRWAAVSTLRGTTHVFAISPYGGACGVRTHTQPRVVNRLSRFHRSAGLPIHAATAAAAAAKHVSGSPVSDGLGHGAWFPNPRLPPYPLPIVSSPLAQLRPTNLPTHTITRTSSGRQRLSSLSEECNSAPLLARARFGPAGYISSSSLSRTPAVTPLYLMTANGCLLHLVLHPRPARNIPKEKICDESPIELEVEPIAQWPLQRPPAAADLLAPLPPSNPLLQQLSCRRCADVCMSEEERWLSQVEIVTHAGPHRRLWMGPQFVFKTYNCTGSNSSLSEAECVEVETSAARSNPVNMPGVRPVVPVLIDSGSPSSLEHSPSDSFRRKSMLADSGRAASVCDVQLREDLAEAMKEDHGWPREESRAGRQPARPSAGIARVVDPQGTVVAPPEVTAPAVDDPDTYTRSNADEATFRPVVRAPAALSLRPDMIVRPLPRNTTIPVQTVPPIATLSPDEPLPLNTDVVIPAQLTAVGERLPDTVAHKDDVASEKSAPRVGDVESVAKVDVDVKEIVNRDLERKDDACERDGAIECSVERAERGSADANESLPKSNRSSGDIQSTAKVRSKERPTPKSVSDISMIDDISDKVNISEVKEIRQYQKGVHENKDITEEVLKKSVEIKGNKEGNEIKEEKLLKESKDFREPVKLKEVKEFKEDKDLREIRKSKEIQSSKKSKQIKEPETKKINPVILDDETSSSQLKSKKSVVDVTKSVSEDITLVKETSSSPFEQSGVEKASLKEKTECKLNRTMDDIKTEEQAWDMLLNESEKSVIPIQSTISNKIIEEPKPKTKKSRKLKKVQDDSQTKADEDSFVEIHAIEENQQVSSGELVSISTPFEDIDCSYLSKTKKSRTLKHITPENVEETVNSHSELEYSNKTGMTKKTDEISQVQVISEPITILKPRDLSKKKAILEVERASSETTSFITKDAWKPNKSKSLSPYLEGHSYGDSDTKDVYVINTTEENFPEIQITKGSKPRKLSPQPLDRKSQEREIVVEKPVKSWSSIAATKTVKKTEETESNNDIVENVVKKDYCDKYAATDSQMSSKSVCLQEKLMELCKRTDIMVAECDVPSELNFVEEHHAVIQELPPLDLDFGLDDFKLEVMRDSLLEVNDAKITSPICKINIDDILSSIKETSAKVIESSSFNLIDLEKIPTKKEKGFSVIESHKITTQEVKIDDDVRVDDKEGEMTEKSSDDDNTSPSVSTDSDKKDKKKVGASKITPLPSGLKSKKSRQKKK